MKRDKGEARARRPGDGARTLGQHRGERKQGVPTRKTGTEGRSSKACPGMEGLLPTELGVTE